MICPFISPNFLRHASFAIASANSNSWSSENFLKKHSGSPSSLSSYGLDFPEFVPEMNFFNGPSVLSKAMLPSSMHYSYEKNCETLRQWQNYIEADIGSNYSSFYPTTTKYIEMQHQQTQINSNKKNQLLPISSDNIIYQLSCMPSKSIEHCWPKTSLAQLAAAVATALWDAPTNAVDPLALLNSNRLQKATGTKIYGLVTQVLLATSLSPSVVFLAAFYMCTLRLFKSSLKELELSYRKKMNYFSSKRDNNVSTCDKNNGLLCNNKSSNQPNIPLSSPNEFLLHQNHHLNLVFTTALILAAKFLEDGAYSSKSWSEITNLSVRELVAFEACALRQLDYKLSITIEVYSSWLSKVQIAISREQKTIARLSKTCNNFLSPTHYSCPVRPAMLPSHQIHKSLCSHMPSRSICGNLVNFAHSGSALQSNNRSQAIENHAWQEKTTNSKLCQSNHSANSLNNLIYRRGNIRAGKSVAGPHNIPLVHFDTGNNGSRVVQKMQSPLFSYENEILEDQRQVSERNQLYWMQQQRKNQQPCRFFLTHDFYMPGASELNSKQIPIDTFKQGYNYTQGSFKPLQLPPQQHQYLDNPSFYLPACARVHGM